MAAIKIKDNQGNWQLLNNILLAPINIVQTTGTSSADVMSQSAVTAIMGEGSQWENGSGQNSAVLKNSSGTASGDFSVAEGKNTTASGNSSHAEGYKTITKNGAEHASGQYNISSSASTTFGDSGNTLFSVGNGTAEDARSNAFEIRQNGDIYIIRDNNIVLLQDEIDNVTVDQIIDNTTSASTNPVSTSAVYGFVTAYTPSITVDQVISNANSASTNPVSTSAVYSALTDTEFVWANAFVAISGAVSSHTSNNEIHITSAEKTKLDSLGTAAYKGVSNGITNSENLIEAKHIYSGVGVTIAYDSSTHYIQLKNTSGSVISDFDASAFIVDGMVENVEIKDVTSGASQVTCLVVSFNTDAGKQNINIPISDIFNANNYYTKSETSGASEISTALGAKVDSATYTGHTADTNVHFSGSEKENLDSLATNIAAISGITSTKVNNWDGAATNSHTHSNKTYLDGITSSVGTMAYENASSYSSATEVNTAFAAKANTATTLSGYGITNAYTKSEIDSMIGDIETLLAAI